jgi:hypothetical protein
MGWFGKRRKKKEKEPEGAQAEEQVLVPTGPELLVLVPEVPGAPTFQINRFRVHDDATAFVRTVSPELLSSAHIFWAMHEGPPPGIDPAGGEALVLIRAAADRDSVHVVSFVDLESAESFARFEVKRGLDLAFVMIYWAAFCQMVETPFGLGIDPLRPPDTRQWRAAMVAAAHAAPPVTSPDDHQAADIQTGDALSPEPDPQPEAPRSAPAEPAATPAYADASNRPPAAGEMMPEREPVSAAHHETVAAEPASHASPEVPHAHTADQPIGAGEAEFRTEPEHVQPTPQPADLETESRHEEIRTEEPVTAPSPASWPDEAVAETREVTAEPAAAQDQQRVADEIHATFEAEPVEPEPMAFGAESPPQEDIIAQGPVSSAPPEFEPDAVVAETPEVTAKPEAAEERPPVSGEDDAAIEPEPIEPPAEPVVFAADSSKEDIIAPEPTPAAPPEFEPDAVVAETPEVTAEPEAAEDQQRITGDFEAPVQPEPEPQAEPVVLGADSPEKDAIAEEANARVVEEPSPAEAVAEAPTDEVAATEHADETTEEPAVAMHDAIADKQDTLEPAAPPAVPDVPATDEPADEQQPAIAEPALTESEDQDSDESVAEPSEPAELEETAASTNGHHADELIPEEQRRDPVVSTEGDEEVAERLLTEALGAESRDDEAKHEPSKDESVIARAQLFERFKMLDVSEPVRDAASASNEEEERRGRKGKKKEKGKAKASAKGKSRSDSSGDEEDAEEPIRVDVSEVAAKTLQVKRWTKQEEPFRGFDSPPGRF